MAETQNDSSKSGSNSSLVKQWTTIAGVVCLYWFVSISMVFLNKYLLSSPDLKLNAPLFITLSQCIIAIVCIALLGLIGSVNPGVVTIPYPEYDISTALKIAPLSIVFVGMITFNNLTLKLLGVAFYNVGRSLTTVFNVIFSYFMLGQKLSMAVMACCGVIVAGFLFGVKEEDQSVADFSFLGILYGVLASMCVALFAIFTKKTLPYVESNIWRLQLYNNINAGFLLSPMLFLLGEHKTLFQFQYWNSLYFWVPIIFAGLFGIAIGYVSSLQIKVTSPLTHNVSGTAKACAQTLLACMYYNEVKSIWWWVCNFMVLGGSSAYTYVRMYEMKASNNAKADVPVPQPEDSEKDLSSTDND